MSQKMVTEPIPYETYKCPCCSQTKDEFLHDDPKAAVQACIDAHLSALPEAEVGDTVTVWGRVLIGGGMGHSTYGDRAFDKKVVRLDDDDPWHPRILAEDPESGERDWYTWCHTKERFK